MMICRASRHPHPASAQQRSRRGRLPAPPSRTWSDQCSRRTHSSRRQRLSTCCRQQCTALAAWAQLSWPRQESSRWAVPSALRETSR